MTKDEIKDRLKILKQSKFEVETLVNVHHNTQLALKTLLNSLFGAMAQPFFRHFNFYNAEAITSSGQFTIQSNTRKVDAYINKLCGTKKINAIYNDTDSIAVSIQGIIDKLGIARNSAGYIDAVCKFADTSLNKQTDTACKEIGAGLNVFENRLSFKREKVFLSGLYVAKKRYALLVVDEEGVRFGEPKTKVTGLEIRRSDTPMVCREAMKRALDIILSKTEPELQTFITGFEEKFNTLSPEEFALPTGVAGLLKYADKERIYTKGCPIHVRAALLHNWMVKEKKLDNKYPLIEDGSKMKFVKLKLPNPVRENVIGFQGTPPLEFDLGRYVDYPQMFEDTFAKATRRMVESAGWSMKHTENVDDWF